MTPHSSIHIIVTADEGAMWAVSKTTFTATAVNIVQVDWTSTITKMSTAEGQCTCLQECFTFLKWKIEVSSCFNLTLSGVSQLLTHDSSIISSPGVNTDCAPLIIHADLHSAFIWNVTSCQSQLTSCTWNCKKQYYVISTVISKTKQTTTELAVPNGFFKL